MPISVISQVANEKTQYTLSELSAEVNRAKVILDQYHGDGQKLIDAATVLNNVIKINPNFAPTYVEVARLILKDGHLVGRKYVDGTLNKAEEALKKAKKIDPSYADIYIVLGYVYFLKDNYTEALETLDQATKLKSTSPWLHSNYGDVYQRMGQLDKADSEYQLIINMGPGNTDEQRNAYIDSLYEQQKIAVKKGDKDRVLKLAKLATAEASPSDAWTWGNVALNLFKMGFFDEAINDSRKALSIMNYGVGQHNLALALYGKGAQLEQQGHKEEAKNYFQEAYSLHPDMGKIFSDFARSSNEVRQLIPVLTAHQELMDWALH
jgi:tetratricopeptide (TPR) repeat protein